MNEIFQQMTPYPAAGDRHGPRIPHLGRPVVSFNRVTGRFARHALEKMTVGTHWLIEEIA
ncbi:hypothetical protein [Mycolicibacterium fortuitum]|uniref:hypothetical protein n=1 Tax=Mycolicibacterium fortuitum TaxID=1766 RepID=UPI00261E6691|nr:hypothetical protein [Mycolicibacterium fortuitum]